MILFAQNLKRLREQRGLSQEELGLASGLGGQSRISNYENGTREPSLRHIEALARTLKVSWIELLGGKGNSQELVDLAAAVVAICDLLRDSVPVAAADLARRIELLSGPEVPPERLVGHLLQRLRENDPPPADPKRLAK